MISQYQLEISTPGRGLIQISNEIAKYVKTANIETGICNIFLHHTSASLSLCENHDPLVLQDLESFMQRFIPDGDPLFKHTDEGEDDMPSHIRSVITQNSINIPITNGKLALGTWQGIYLWEHRLQAHKRRITLTMQS